MAPIPFRDRASTEQNTFSTISVSSDEERHTRSEAGARVSCAGGDGIDPPSLDDRLGSNYTALTVRPNLPGRGSDSPPDSTVMERCAVWSGLLFRSLTDLTWNG